MIRLFSTKIVLFGICNGICLLLSSFVVNFWLSSLNVDLATIGLFSLTALPYFFKYFISPLVDNFKISLFKKSTRIRSWMILSQITIIISLILISQANPLENIYLFALLASIISFFGALLEVTFNTLRIETLGDRLENQGNGSANYISGYRIGMMISGAGAVYLSNYLSWEQIYLIFAMFLAIVFLAISHLTKYDEIETNIEKVKMNWSFKQAIKSFTEPLISITSFKNIMIIIAFLFLYRIADNCIYVMSNPFLLEMGFNASEIASVVKIIGIIGSVSGGFFAGWLIEKLIKNRKIKFILLLFGVLHNFTHLLYIAQAEIGHDIFMLNILIFSESFTGGMAMVAYISYMSSLCGASKSGKSQTATQYAAFSSIMGLSRVVLPSFSGLIVEQLSWVPFFSIMFILSFSSFIILPFLFTKDK